MPPFDKITIINIDPLNQGDVNTELQWIGASLGLFGERDKDSSCFRVFVNVFNASIANKSVSSNEVANSCELARGTVIHHLNKLQEAGLIIHRTNRYLLSGNSMEDSVRKIENDVKNMLEKLNSVAHDIDMRVGK